MSKMITTAPGFQSSVNIAYDLNDNNKLKSYIPTKSALKLLEDVLLSTYADSNARARILIGAYGKGKSHIVLMILSILMKKDLSLFEQMMPKVEKDYPKLYQLIKNYYASDNKLLPVIITGSSTSLSQSFLLALQRTLEENELMDIMPETSFKAAVSTIGRWKNEYPEVFAKMEEMLDIDSDIFVDRLTHYDPVSYEQFEKIYPQLTAGSTFNPFVGFDVNELYENVVKSLKTKGYSGIYVIYDEFSKYLENNIVETTKRDTKTLQDFAEKCNRSGKEQLHLMLISHKEITSYIDRVSKEMIDGWRGVSERFIHVYLNNNFTQTYEIIASAIIKNDALWHEFVKTHQGEFSELSARYAEHPIFSDTTSEGMHQVIYECYPLHPVSTFILPRLSERVAQNERTLFTFISAKGASTLHSFLNEVEDTFSVVTPDVIYDYFEPLLQQEVYSGNLHKYYVLTTAILNKIDRTSLEGKIVKSIALIYILEQFEKLKPTIDELIGIYSTSYSPNEIKNAIDKLIDKEFVIYLKRSNNYLKLKETSGVDVKAEIRKQIEKQGDKANVKTILNEANFDNYMYPSRYNDEKEMTRFFAFEFINAKEISDDTDWNVKSEGVEADGVVYGIISNGSGEINDTIRKIRATSKGCKKAVFVILRKYKEIEGIIREYNAVDTLKKMAVDDPILFNDYEVVYEDMRDVIRDFISKFTHPETVAARYYHNGECVKVRRKCDLTELLSTICDDMYSDAPVVINEVINKNYPSTQAINSANKIIAGLLRNELEPNLGLVGNGQEISIMRSTLLNTGVLTNESGAVKVNLQPNDPALRKVLGVIVDFVKSAKGKEKVYFTDLYEALTTDKYHIGMRRGLIPIYLSAVLHEFKKKVIISDRVGQIPTSMDAVIQINSEPKLFTLSYLDWNQEKEDYVKSLETLFSDSIVEAEKTVNGYDYIVSAMKRWYMALPKYAKEFKRDAEGNEVNRKYRNFILELKKNSGHIDFLFKKIPSAFGYDIVESNPKLIEEIAEMKHFYDNVLTKLIDSMADFIKETFATKKDAENYEKMSLLSVVKDWCDTLDTAAFEQLFGNGTERCLDIFKNGTNDTEFFVKDLGKAATDLRMEDWDDEVIKFFKQNMVKYKETAEGFHREKTKESTESTSTKSDGASTYALSFTDDDGKTTTKRFNKVEESRRAKLLYNNVRSQLEAMGQSITEQEKRQVLMKLLTEIC